MSTFNQLHSNFSYGELSQRLHARVDFEGYYKGAKRIRNLLVIPQGGVRRRFGTKFIVGLKQTQSYDEFRLGSFSYNAEIDYLLIFTPGWVSIYRDGTSVDDVATPYAAVDLPNLRYAQTNNQLIIVNGDDQPRVLELTAPDTFSLTAITFKVKPCYDFGTLNYDATTFTPSATSGTNATITASAAIFTNNYIGGIFVGHGGTFRINSLDSTSIARGPIITEFINTDAILGKYSFLAEPCWSDTLGWPSRIGFYQNRLVLANTSSLPTGLWLSETNQYFSFDEYTYASDTSAIGEFIQSKDVNIIEHVLGVRSLLIFTSAGEYSTPLLETGAITPTTFSVTQQTSHGTSEVEPISLDNQVFFVEEGGKIVRALNYDLQRGSYSSTNATILSPQVIDNPIASAVYENADIDDGTYLFLINEGGELEGSIATLQSIVDENIKAWSLQTTPGADGLFRHITALKNVVWFGVERTIDGGTEFYVEQLDFECMTDCAKEFDFGAPTTNITTLEHLEGETVKVLGRNSTDDVWTVCTDQVVDSGEIDSDVAFDYFQIGLDFSTAIDLTLMPINIQTQVGQDLYSPKHINTVFVDYMNSLSITINGLELPDLSVDGTVLDSPPELLTGVSKYTPMGGWDPRFEVTLSQAQPYPLLIIGVGVEAQLD